MWVLVHHSVPVLIIKVRLEKCQKYPNKGNVYQKQFHCHFNSKGHNVMEDWKIIIIDRAEKFLEVRHGLDTFIPNGLNERFVGICML